MIRTQFPTYSKEVFQVIFRENFVEVKPVNSSSQ